MDNEEKLYRQSEIAQLVKIEKDLRKLNETMLCMVIQEIELNALTLKTLQVQFNVMAIKPVEIEKELATLMELVKSHSEKIKEVSNTLSLPAPSGNE
jgi:hypothetical protein